MMPRNAPTNTHGQAIPLTTASVITRQSSSARHHTRTAKTPAASHCLYSRVTAIIQSLACSLHFPYHQPTRAARFSTKGTRRCKTTACTFRPQVRACRKATIESADHPSNGCSQSYRPRGLFRSNKWPRPWEWPLDQSSLRPSR